jgi:hypothetical protein
VVDPRASRSASSTDRPPAAKALADESTELLATQPNPAAVAPRDSTPLPDPGETGTRFLGWLIRQGRARLLRTCERAFGRELDIEGFVKTMGPARIRIQRTRGGAKVVVIFDLVWAKAWADRSPDDVRHHSSYALIRK